VNDDRKPRDFDWVSVRARCSLVAVYESLHQGAAANAKPFNALKTGRPDVDVVSKVPNVFAVVRPEYGQSIAVRFVLEHDAIRVEGSGADVRMVLTLTLNDAGDCRVLLNKQELDEWQVLRRALEPLLFARGE
jgi:hypothetical protein